jgi:hypothetical protein
VIESVVVEAETRRRWLAVIAFGPSIIRNLVLGILSGFCFG